MKKNTVTEKRVRAPTVNHDYSMFVKQHNSCQPSSKIIFTISQIRHQTTLFTERENEVEHIIRFEDNLFLYAADSRCSVDRK